MKHTLLLVLSFLSLGSLHAMEQSEQPGSPTKYTCHALFKTIDKKLSFDKQKQEVQKQLLCIFDLKPKDEILQCVNEVAQEILTEKNNAQE